VLFFQVVLLLGYIYAHALGRFFNVKQQTLVHGAVLLLSLAFLPMQFDAAPTEGAYYGPILWLMGRLAATVGVPFFAISATAPLLQNWLSTTAHPAARDPYFLYSASNAGSLLALLAFPFVIEPQFGVSSQSWLWLAGYGVLFVLLLASAMLIRGQAPRHSAADGLLDDLRPGWNTKLFWIGAAFVPSGLMLAVTNHITSNLASAPFLWVVPLALYLLTFILAFAKRYRASTARISQLAPIILLVVFPFVAADVIAPPGLNWLLIVTHLVVLYCGALLCHTALAERRPSARHLTEFYFWIALAGVLGGIFTATVAPVIFNTVLEYPLLVALLPFFRVPQISGQEGPRTRQFDFVWPALLAAALLITWIVFEQTEVDSDNEVQAFAHTAFLFFVYKLKDRVQRFALAFIVLLAAYTMAMPSYLESGRRLHVDRNFFGVKKISDTGDGTGNGYRWFTHGDTLHGMESLDPARRGYPISYYHPTGPVGEIMRILDARDAPQTQHIGVLGLGAGTMATYGKSGRRVTFYEIDPDVETAARKYFSFLTGCGNSCDVQIGDGRLRLLQEPDGKFDLLMLDAFSSDSVPAHLLSREAVQLYVSKLKPEGILLFNVSNRYLRVNKLVEALLKDANLSAFTRFDEAGVFRSEGKSNSSYVVAARHPEHLATIPEDASWLTAVFEPEFRLWTDDYSNLLSLIRWY
jgi:SAM-dependent methyltransferase